MESSERLRKARKLAEQQKANEFLSLAEGIPDDIVPIGTSIFVAIELAKVAAKRLFPDDSGYEDA